MKKIYFSLLILLVGLFPQALQAQSELWGVTTSGGDGFGSLYSMPTGSTGIAFQRNFAGASGSSPQQTRMIQASNGKLYGVLISGGFNNVGVLFEYDIATNTYTKRYDFNSANGSSPRGPLMQASDGKLYGTTSAGGANNVGVLYQYDISTNTYTKKYDFVSANGSQPFGGLVEPTTPNGKLYGMSRLGGTSNLGTIYEYDLSTSVYTKKIDLDATSGNLPFGELTQSGSLFYGLTSAGGTSSVGTIVEYDYGTNTLTKKYDFVAANGSSPQGTLLRASNGVLYGATTTGGTNSVGVIFQYSVASSAYTKLVDFVSASGCEGRGLLVQAANGKLYGLTRIGGANNNGAIYEYSISTTSYTKLFDLQSNASIGGGPLGSLTYASNGKLYGLTTSGGIAGAGVIFEYDISTSTYTKKVDLNLGIAGAAPNGGPVYAANGKIYGNAISGGTNNVGAIYEYNRLTSTYTKKYDFVTASGSAPYGSMMEASNNKLYGMTNAGGVNGLGVIYEYDYAANLYTKKFDFSSINGSLPFGNLVQAGNGKLYGLTRSGGTSGLGVLFEYDYATNTYTKKADLTTSTGSQPSGSLIEAPNGKLYGLTQLGGVNGVGVIFEYDYTTNTLTKKIDLLSVNGGQPLGSLVLGPDGMLYGMTQFGGNNNLGVLFQYDYTTNTYTKEIDFSSTTGSSPRGSLIKAVSGTLYGVTAAAGTNSVGTLFSYSVSTNTFTKLLDFSQSTGCSPGYTSLLEVCPKPENAGSIAAASPSLCSGNASSQTFSIAVLPSALSYTWSLPAGASITTGSLTNVITANLGGLTPGAFTFSVGGVNTCGTGSLSTLAYSINITPTVAASGGTICAGGFYTINPTGANTYSYSGGSNIVSPSITTNYSVTGTSSLGCVSSNTAVVTVSVNALPVVTANSSTNAVCNGATVSLSGGGASSYTWSGGITNGVAFAPTITTNYTVTGVDGNGCQNTAVKTVTVYALPTVSTIASSTAICVGGTVSISGSGASTYTWTGGVVNGVAFSPTLSNTYTVTGTDINGCQNTDSRAITVNVLPVVSANTSTSAVCVGFPVTLTGTGANTYTWTGGVSNNVAFTPNTTLTYSVSGTSTAGCTSTNVANVTVTVYARPVVAAATSTTAVCAGQSVTLNGSGANTYTWTGGATNNIAFAPSSTTTFSVSGTSTAGCTSTNVAAVTVTVNTLPVLTANTTSNVVCFGNNITLSGGGANTYTWSSSIGGTYTNAVAFTPTATATYSVIGTSTAGCNSAGAAAVTVTVNALPVVSANTSTSAVCIGFPVTLTGGGASTYTWTGGVSNNVAFTPSTTITYSVSGTSTAGCTSTNVANVTVTVYARPLVSANTSTASVCFGQSVTLSGSGANTYTWTSPVSNGVAFAPASTANYSVSGTSTAGCTSTNVANITITVNPLPVLTASASNPVICFNGTTSLNGAGASTYSWASASGTLANGVAFSPVSTNSYTLAGLSVFGCLSSNFPVVSITVNPLPTVTATSGTICSGQSFTIPVGGASTYTYSGGSVVSPTTTTSYSVTGSSTAGCVSASPAVLTVTVYALPLVSVNSGSICNGASIVLTPSISSGGAASYSFSGATSSVTAGSVVVSPTSTSAVSVYSVSATNSLGCLSSNVAVSTVTVRPLPTLTVNNGVICNGAVFTPSSTGALTYTYSFVGSSVSPSVTSTYSVIGSNGFGCVSSPATPFTVTVNQNPTVTIAGSNSLCAGYSLTLTANGASTYSWNTTPQSTQTAVVVSPTTNITYSVNGVDGNNCSNIGVLSVTVVPSPTISAISGVICPSDVFTITPSGAVTYTITGGTALVSPSVTTSYSVTGTNSLGCVSLNTAVVTVTVVNSVVVTISGNTVVCAGQSVSLTASGPNSFTWNASPTLTTATIVDTPTANTSYSVFGSTGACSNTAAINVVVNPLPSVIAVSSASRLCVNESATLSASGASAYTWTPGSAGALLVVTPTVSTTYTVKGIDGNGCENVATIGLVVDACVGIKNVATSNTDWVLYPNPNQGLFSIQLSQPALLTVENSLGQVVLKDVLSEGINQINLGENARGIYFVRVKTGAVTKTVKVIKE